MAKSILICSRLGGGAAVAIGALALGCVPSVQEDADEPNQKQEETRDVLDRAMEVDPTPLQRQQVAQPYGDKATLDSGDIAYIGPSLDPPDLLDPPPFTPRDVAPRLIDPEAYFAAVARAHPPDLRNQGIGGVVLVWIKIDEVGVVQEAWLARSSENGTLDSIAVELAGSLRFTPAKNRGEDVAVWLAMPFRFAVNVR